MESKALALTLSMRNTPGPWAILLGAGISRSAGVPSIAEIEQHVCRQLAAAKTGGPVNDPRQWYSEQFGRELDWEGLMWEVAPSPEARAALLRPYFVPSQGHHELGPSEPAQTQRVIAQLAYDGFVRVVILTAIDDLMETALRDRGVEYQVAASPADWAALRPPSEIQCTLLKVNGSWDRPDARLTEEAKAAYPPVELEYLDDIFANFALVSVAWSARSDRALREALKRRRIHRHAWYWLQRGEQFTDGALEMIMRAEMSPIVITDANQFLSTLLGRVEAPARQTGPIVSDVPARLREYLADDEQDSELENFLVQAVASIYKRADSPMAQASGDPSKFSMLLDGWLEHTRGLRGALAVMAIEARTDRQRRLLCNAIERLSLEGMRQMPSVLAMPLLPTMLVLYTAGIAAVARDRYMNLRYVLVEPELNRPYQDPIPVIGQVNLETFSYDRRFLPVSNNRSVDAWSTYLRHALQPGLEELLDGGLDYDTAFVRLEFLFGLVAIDRLGLGEILMAGTGGKREGGICGEFAWNREGMEIVERFLGEGSEQGSSWGVLTCLFDGDAARLERALREYGRFIRAVTGQETAFTAAAAAAGTPVG